MTSQLERELIEFGLSEKAAKVYLASLELGPSAVQEIAKKADINRPTCYVMIEDLTEKGLMSSFEKGKRRYFTAENPDHFLNIIRENRREIEKKEERIKNILGDLRALKAFSASSPNVSYYEGLEGINALREDVIRSKSKTIYELVPVDDVRKFIPEEPAPDDSRKIIREKVSVKSLYYSKKGAIYPEKDGISQRRFVPVELFPISCEVVIYGNKVAFLSYSGKPTGFLVDNQYVADTMKMMFQALWEAVKLMNKKTKR